MDKLRYQRKELKISICIQETVMNDKRRFTHE